MRNACFGGSPSATNFPASYLGIGSKLRGDRVQLLRSRTWLSHEPAIRKFALELKAKQDTPSFGACGTSTSLLGLWFCIPVLRLPSFLCCPSENTFRRKYFLLTKPSRTFWCYRSISLLRVRVRTPAVTVFPFIHLRALLQLVLRYKYLGFLTSK